MTTPTLGAGSAQQLRLTAAAAVATALSTVALVPLYDGRGWWWRALGAVLAVALSGGLARAYRWHPGWQVLLTTAVLVDYVCLVFVRSTLALGLLPGRETWQALQALFTEGVTDISVLTLPVPTKPGLVLVATAGVGVIALLVDTAAVTLGRAVLSGVGLLVLFAVPGAVRSEGVGWFPFALTAVGWLTLVLVEGQGRNGRWGSAVDPKVSRATGGDTGQARVGRRIGSAALGLAVVVPVLLPGLNARLLPGGNGLGEGDAGARTTTTYNPITRLRADLRLPEPRPVLTYRTDAARPDYLRLTTLDRFSDSGWTSSRLSGTVRRDGVDKPLPDPIGLEIAPTQPVRTTIGIQQLQARWLPVPFPPRSVLVDGPWLYDDISETVFGIRTDTKDLTSTYTVAATVVRPDRDQLEGIDGPLPAALQRYTAPPAMTPSVAALTDRVVRGQRTDYDKVLAIQAFFTAPGNRFVYDTSPSVPGLNGPSALEDFLTSRRGFCEQYASAMGAMIRRAGVPARVAVGFTPGRRAEDGSYAVTTDDAHAWPEAWFPGAGWVRFEPTPRSDGQTTVPDYARPADAAPVAPVPSAAPSAATPTDGPSAGPQPDGGQTEAPVAGAGSQGGRNGWAQAALLLVGLLLGTGALLAVPGLVHRVRRTRRWRGAGSPAIAWQQLRDDVCDLGLPWYDADSPRRAAERIASAVPVPVAVRDALTRLVTAVERARYAPPGPQPEGHGLQADSEAVRHALLAGVPRSRRLRALALPASTVGWAVHGVGSRVADLLDAVDDTWSALRRRVRLDRAG